MFGFSHAAVNVLARHVETASKGLCGKLHLPGLATIPCERLDVTSRSWRFCALPSFFITRQAFEGWVQVSERGHSRRALRLFCEGPIAVRHPCLLTIVVYLSDAPSVHWQGYHSQALLCKALVALQQFAEATLSIA
eukprot:6100666-Amphidinium_carterae.2